MNIKTNTDRFINFTLSQLAKTKGIRIVDLTTIIAIKNFHINYFYTSTGEVKYLDTTEAINENDQELYPILTLNQLNTWLNQQHSINVEVIEVALSSYMYMINDWKTDTATADDIIHTDPANALEAGLIAVFELLPTVP